MACESYNRHRYVFVLESIQGWCLHKNKKMGIVVSVYLWDLNLLVCYEFQFFVLTKRNQRFGWKSSQDFGNLKKNGCNLGAIYCTVYVIVQCTINGKRKLHDLPGGQTFERKSCSVFKRPELARRWPVRGSLLRVRRLEEVLDLNILL